MSRIGDLIKELAPDGVRYKTLASLGHRNAGTAITAAKMKMIQSEGGPVRVFAGGQTIADVAADAVPAKDVIREPSIIVKSRGHVGFSYYERPFTHKAELWSYTLTDPSVDQKFVYYYLLTKTDHLQAVARATSVKLPQLGVRDTDTLSIPVPPLAVQREIVRVLDLFTELEAKLQAELEARQLQYTHYRGSLFNFTERDNIRWAMLSDVATFRRGTAITAMDTTPGDVPVVANGPAPIYFHKESNRSSETIVVARSGAYAGAVSFWDQPIFLTDAFSVHPDADLLMPKFVFHFLRTKQERLHSMKKGSGVPHVRVKDVEAYEIPVPALAEQERIVTIIDKFYALVNDRSIGLPAELNARRKQYEYYRDRLLNFRELAA